MGILLFLLTNYLKYKHKLKHDIKINRHFNRSRGPRIYCMFIFRHNFGL